MGSEGCNRQAQLRRWVFKGVGLVTGVQGKGGGGVEGGGMVGEGGRGESGRGCGWCEKGDILGEEKRERRRMGKRRCARHILR